MELSGVFPCIHVAVSENFQELFCYISLPFLIYSSQYSFRWKFFIFHIRENMVPIFLCLAYITCNDASSSSINFAASSS